VNELVLGDNRIAYAANFGEVRAFNADDGASLWTYSPGLFVNLVGALTDGGLIVNQSHVGLVTLDSSGRVMASLGSEVASAVPWAVGNWAGTFCDSFAFFSGPATRFLASGFPILFGDAQNQRREETPQISNFVPSHLSNANGFYDFLDFVTEMRKTFSAPQALNKFFVRGQLAVLIPPQLSRVLPQLKTSYWKSIGQ